MSRKRLREHPTVDTHLVEIYEDLANVDEKIRLKAAHSLLTGFICQENASLEQLNEILRRLIRGLCSSRKAARLGFSVALTELLVELFGHNNKHAQGFQAITELLETLKIQTHVSGNVSGQEERDHQFGRLFGAEAIIKSKILLHPNVPIHIWNQTLDIIYELAMKKPWLREECGFILFTSVQMLQEQDSQRAQSVIDKLHTNGLSKTCEGVAIWISLYGNFPDLQFPSGIWHRENPLHHKEIRRLARILKEAPAKENTDNVAESKHLQNGAWSSNVHFAWDVILTKLLTGEPAIKESEKSKNVSFARFWEQCVDDNLFAAASSDERKYWGFQLFQRMITNAPAHLTPYIFSKNFMRCLMNQLASPDRYLHRTAERAKKSILARARLSPNVRPLILTALLMEPYGNLNFDKMTKTKTVEYLLAHIDDSTLKQMIPIYDVLILQPGVQDDKAATSTRIAVADQLLSAVRNLPAEDIEHDFESLSLVGAVPMVLSLLVKYAYFDLDEAPEGQHNKPSPPISQASRHIFRSRIASCLTYLTAQSKDPGLVPYHLMLVIRSREEGSESGGLLLVVDDTVRKVIKTTRKRLKEITLEVAKSPQNSSKGQYLRSLRLLYSLTFLQVYNEEAEAVSMLEELNDMENVQEGSATLVEVLLSFSSKPSQLFRRLTQSVFTACASLIDEAGLQSMFRVLEAKESLSGQAEMFEQENADASVSEEDSVEMVDMDYTSSGSPDEDENSSDDDSDSSSESTETDSDANDTELAAFNAKLAQALGTRPGNEDLTAEDSGSSDEDMNSEQMEALDDHLKEVFRERKKVKSKKTEKKDAKETIVNFKCRVLDLLEIYVKQQHANRLALSLLLPLLRCIRATTSPQVSSKACNVMREYARVCKGDRVPGIEDTDAIFDLLGSVHAEAMKEGSNAYVSACSQASLLLVKVLVAHDREWFRRVLRIYGDTQEKCFFDANCKVKPAFFTDWQNWCTSARKQ